MTPTVTADRLVFDFSECGEDGEMYIETAKACALLCCRIIIGEPNSDIEYWREVMEEIKNIKS